MWLPWEMQAWASDPNVKALSFHWRGVYFDLLNSVMLNGEIEWRATAFRMRYRDPSEPKATEEMLVEIKRLFASREEEGREYISHPKADEKRAAYFKRIEQTRVAAAASAAKRSKGERSADAQRTLSERSADAERGTSTSLSSSLSGSKDTENTEVNSKKAEQWARGLDWVRSLPERDQQYVAHAIETVKRTRRGGKIAESVLQEILYQLSRFPETAAEACDIYSKDHPEKNEKYLIGIARRMAEEKSGIPRARP